MRISWCTRSRYELHAKQFLPQDLEIAESVLGVMQIMFSVGRTLVLGGSQEACALNAMYVVRELVQQAIIDIHSLRALPWKFSVICSLLQFFCEKGCTQHSPTSLPNLITATYVKNIKQYVYKVTLQSPLNYFQGI